MSDQVVAALIGLGGVLVGALLAGGVSLYQARVAANERRETRREQNLMAAFQYFDGKTQRRSVGLSIIEAGWRQTPKLLPMFVPLLAYQAIHLIAVSGGGEDAALEHKNLDRIVDLLALASVESGTAGDFSAVQEALAKKKRGEYQKGLPLDGPRIDAYCAQLTKTPDL